MMHGWSAPAVGGEEGSRLDARRGACRHTDAARRIVASADAAPWLAPLPMRSGRGHVRPQRCSPSGGLQT